MENRCKCLLCGATVDNFEGVIILDKVYHKSCFAHRDELILIKKEQQKKLGNYKKAYGILMDWFDYIPDEDKEEVSKELEKLGL